MKRFFLIALAVAFIATTAYGQATVVDTAHDLSGTVAGSDQVCVFCHTPHGSNVDAVLDGKAPLWNQDMPTTGSYGVYTSDTFDATDIAAIDTGSYSDSLLCMSCHDGTVAPGTFYNAPNIATGEGTSTATTITGSANVGTSLSNDHPVNFTWQSSLDGGDTGLVASEPTTYLDANGMVQCSSCHDPHDATQDTTVDFMRDTLVDSGLCTNCHVK